MIAHGYSDMVTPYAVSRYVLDHLPTIGDPSRAQLRIYRGGHMFYIDANSRRAFSTDAKAFYQDGEPMTPVHDRSRHHRASGQGRDQFIPVRKADILDALVEHGTVRQRGGAQAQFRQVCRCLAAIYHYEYFERARSAAPRLLLLQSRA